MKENSKLGNSTKTGLNYEIRKRKDFFDFFHNSKEFSIIPKYNKNFKNDYFEIFKNKKPYGFLLKQHGLYKFLKEKNINWKQYLSKKLLPDQAIFIIKNNIIYIIEIKFQKVNGSVDEKLQTCDFKKKHYEKLFYELNIKVKFIYLLNEWFKKEMYTDTLNYINSVDCNYYFDSLIISKIIN